MHRKKSPKITQMSSWTVSEQLRSMKIAFSSLWLGLAGSSARTELHSYTVCLLFCSKDLPIVHKFTSNFFKHYFIILLDFFFLVLSIFWKYWMNIFFKQKISWLFIVLSLYGLVTWKCITWMICLKIKYWSDCRDIWQISEYSF